MSDDLRVRQYDNWRKISERNSVICIYGSRGSGKSHLLAWLLCEMDRKKAFDFAFVMTPTSSTQELLCKYVAPSGIHTDMNPESLETVVMVQKMQPKKHRIVIVLDDCAYDKKISKSNVVNEVAANGRHLGITLILTFQYLTMISPEIRTNCDLAIAFKEISVRNLEMLYDNFFGVVENLSTFRIIMSSICKKYRALICDHTRDSASVGDCLWMCKAPERVERYRVAGLQWRMHDRFGLSSKEITRSQRKEYESRLVERGVLPAKPAKRRSKVAGDNATMVVFEREK